MLKRYIKNLHANSIAVLRYDGHTSPTINVKRCTRQGDPLSMPPFYLFDLVLSGMSEKFAIRIHNKLVKHMAFANDFIMSSTAS